MNNTIIPVSLLLILVSFVPISSASMQNSTLDSQGNYANLSLGITFQAPAGWTVQEPKKSQPDAPDIAVIAPYSGGFTPSISFTIEKSNGTTLDDYIKNKNSQLINASQSSNILFLSEQDGTIGGVDAKISLLQENFTSQNSSNAIRFKQATVLTNNEFYTITYANKESNFDSDLSSYDQLLGSIKFMSNDTSFSWTGYLFIGIAGAALIAGAIIAIKRKSSQKNISSDK
ncbi:MAG: hypothetical protein KGH89_01245 [Thaumarchaeota archaeon]|nr:hypothetical protein [Nitrososphaerota archaeon]MDE1866169.1 hypothetical protein [Nitrososphaerota archaeon]